MKVHESCAYKKAGGLCLRLFGFAVRYAVIVLHAVCDQLDYIRRAFAVTGLPFFDGPARDMESRTEGDLRQAGIGADRADGVLSHLFSPFSIWHTSHEGLSLCVLFKLFENLAEFVCFIQCKIVLFDELISVLGSPSAVV